MIKKIKKIILDTLFPIACISCQKSDFWICKKCFQKIPILREQVCPACEREITLSGFLCQNCRRKEKNGLDALISAVSYDNPIVKIMVYNFKYRFTDSLSKPLAQLQIKALLQNNLPLPQAIVPVPLHPRRLRWRGFNQALLIAKSISKNLVPPLEIPVLDILERKKYNQPQMKLKKYEERLQNVKDLFRIKSDTDDKVNYIKGKFVYLVDDVATTGATLKECAKVLKKIGVKKVFAIVIARQTLKK